MINARLLATFMMLAVFLNLAKIATSEKDETDNSTNRIVSVSLLQPVADLLSQAPMASYQERLRGPNGRDSASLYLTEHASGRNLGPTATGGPIIFRYAAKNCTISLPAGRQLLASTEGPVVGRAAMILPMEPMTWDEMQVEVTGIVKMFDESGWVRTGLRPVKSPVRQEDFSTDVGPKFAQVGQWRECDDGPAKATMTVQHYNSLTGSSFTPPAALSEPLPEDAPDRFLIYISFFPATEQISNNLSDLVMARRASEGIDPAYHMLPASIWLDDPDWRPPGWSGGF